MNKYIITVLKNFIALICIGLVLITCKKSKDEPVSIVPVVLTSGAAYVGREWATLKGSVNGEKQMTTVIFQYDTSTAYANSVSPSPDTTSGNTSINFSALLTNLTPNTKYHYRINAVSVGGDVNGGDASFTTTDTTGIVINFNPDLSYDSIYDFEGNKYRTIQIGEQTWMAENLRSLKFNDGTDIPFVPDAYKWSILTTPGYTWYDSDSVGYGALYNWYTVETGILCPAGWHVPADEEWTVLTDYLGGKSDAGGKLKETGTIHWFTPNFEATNESGFTALPAGYRSYGGYFRGISDSGLWWSSTEWSSSGAWYRAVNYNYASVDRSNSMKSSGGTVRCLKD
jgi:uncharacterized protein (TIGR02145 family)